MQEALGEMHLLVLYVLANDGGAASVLREKWEGERYHDFSIIRVKTSSPLMGIGWV